MCNPECLNKPTNPYEYRRALCQLIVKQIEDGDGFVRYSEMAGEWYCECCDARGSLKEAVVHTEQCGYGMLEKHR